MTKAFLSVLGALVLGLAAAAVTAGPPPKPAVVKPPPAGQEIFQRKNCQICHSIEVAGLVRKRNDPKIHAPDLSHVGATHSAAQLREFLTQNGGREPGKRHWKRFWGTEDELDALLSWLVGLDGVKPLAASKPASTPKPRP